MEIQGQVVWALIIVVSLVLTPIILAFPVQIGYLPAHLTGGQCDGCVPRICLWGYLWRRFSSVPRKPHQSVRFLRLRGSSWTDREMVAACYICDLALEDPVHIIPGLQTSKA